MRTLLRIGELATHAGVSPRTIDYYTQLGLIDPVQRSDGGHRLYDPATADTINTIKQLEAHGIGLNAIADALHTTDDANDSQRLTATLTNLAECLADLQQAITDTPAVHGRVCQDNGVSRSISSTCWWCGVGLRR